MFRSQLLSQPTISWVAFGWPDGSFFAGHKLGDNVIEMLEIAPDSDLRINRYEFVGNDLKLKASWSEQTDYSVTEQDWFRVARQTDDEYWSTLTAILYSSSTSICPIRSPRSMFCPRFASIFDR